MVDSSAATFTDNLLKPGDITPRPIISHHEYWIPVLLLILFIIYVGINVVSGKRFRQIILGYFSGRAVSQLIREEFAISNRVSVFLSAVYVLNLSLFIYLV